MEVGLWSPTCPPPGEPLKRLGDLAVVNAHCNVYSDGELECDIEMLLLHIGRPVVGSVEAVLLATRALVELPAQADLRHARIQVEAEYRHPEPPLTEQAAMAVWELLR